MPLAGYTKRYMLNQYSPKYILPHIQNLGYFKNQRKRFCSNNTVLHFDAIIFRLLTQ